LKISLKVFALPNSASLYKRKEPEFSIGAKERFGIRALAQPRRFSLRVQFGKTPVLKRRVLIEQTATGYPHNLNLREKYLFLV
jgi:hypothetical protein